MGQEALRYEPKALGYERHSYQVNAAVVFRRWTTGIGRRARRYTCRCMANLLWTHFLISWFRSLAKTCSKFNPRFRYRHKRLGFPVFETASGLPVDGVVISYHRWPTRDIFACCPPCGLTWLIVHHSATDLIDSIEMYPSILGWEVQIRARIVQFAWDKVFPGLYFRSWSTHRPAWPPHWSTSNLWQGVVKRLKFCAIAHVCKRKSGLVVDVTDGLTNDKKKATFNL